ncbi:MAG: GDP-mannose 4,6-dehydratase [archaeon]|nr:GDP-mannose 4,6-dehydratase [archaeon]
MSDFWKGKNVFVTGADGFIGSWVAKELVGRKANVTVIVRDIKKEACFDLHGLRPKVNVVQGDIVDLAVLERSIAEYEVGYVFHLAAQAIVGIANKSPLSTFESNIKGTWNVLEACRKKESVKGLVVASSDKAYGVQEKLPYTEDSPLLGTYTYDASKACADILAKSYFATYGLPVAITRNANTYGGADMNFSRIVPDAIRCLIKNETFNIRSNGEPERDYMYVKDAASSYLALAENISRKEVRGGAFNFGTETPIRVVELFKKIAKIFGKPSATVKILNESRNEIPRQYLSTEKARKILGWKPAYSLDGGLKETIDWYKLYFKTKN